jgi:hypothetical protein
MASGFQCNTAGLTDAMGIPATAVVSPNVRVKATLGALATVADIVQFSGPTIMGNWLVPATRCQVGGIPAICATSSSITYVLVLGVPTPSGPMQLMTPDQRAQGA